MFTIYVTKDHIRRVRSRYKVGMNIDMIMPTSDPDSEYRQVRATIIGVYPHILQLEYKGKRWSISYSDLIIILRGNEVV